MKRLLIIFIIIFFNISSANADYITTSTFVVNAVNTITVVPSGNLNSSIDAFTGVMSTPLNINFNINTNDDIKNINLNAYVIDSASNKHRAFYCTQSGISTNHAMYLTLGNSTHLPDATAINNCKSANCSCIENPNAIAYPGTVNINNNGTLEYNSDGYFVAQIKSGITDLKLVLSTTPKSGTYNFNTAEDISDTYQVEIYLDNLP